MRIVAPSAEIVAMEDGADLLRRIEAAGRTCYKSEDRITPDSAAAFVERILKSGHHSVLEHASCTVRFVCDRGVSHELVRHRLASYSQESTRYANYSKERFGGEIAVIRPPFWPEDSPEFALWREAMLAAERAYLALTGRGVPAQEARSVLPTCLKTEVVVTANIREWRHIFSLRCAPAAHPQIRGIMLPLLAEMHARVPVLFADLFETFREAVAGARA